MSSLPALHNRGQPINQGATLGSQWPGRLRAADYQGSVSPLSCQYVALSGYVLPTVTELLPQLSLFCKPHLLEMTSLPLLFHSADASSGDAETARATGATTP